MSRFNILAIAQEGRLGFEALLLAASLRRSSPGFQGKLFLAEPQVSKKWPGGAAIQNSALREALLALGAGAVAVPRSVRAAPSQQEPPPPAMRSPRNGGKSRRRCER